MIALALISGYMAVEIVVGILSGSLALLADAAHMLTDAGAIGLALFAMWIASRSASIERTFGYYRTEVLAALFNALSLWLIDAWIFFEAYRRFRDIPEVEGGIVLAVGGVGPSRSSRCCWKRLPRRLHVSIAPSATIESGEMVSAAFSHDLHAPTTGTALRGGAQ